MMITDWLKIQCTDSFFEDAKHGLLKDLVDFHNRDDFD